MEAEFIYGLMNRLTDSTLSELELTQGDERLVLRKPEVTVAGDPAVTSVVAQPTVAPIDIAVPDAAATSAVQTTPIEAPLVGVVYLTPEPGAAPYKQVGDHVNAGEIVCIIESMKMMNEIQSPVSGTITAVQVESESLVEYHQPLFAVEED